MLPLPVAAWKSVGWGCPAFRSRCHVLAEGGFRQAPLPLCANASSSPKSDENTSPLNVVERIQRDNVCQLLSTDLLHCKCANEGTPSSFILPTLPWIMEFPS